MEDLQSLGACWKLWGSGEVLGLGLLNDVVKELYKARVQVYE